MTRTYTQLADGRWQRMLTRTLTAEDTPQTVICWYMRDNHTFRQLPLNVAGALAALREERDTGNPSGMLCGKPSGVVPAVIHTLGVEDWPEFEVAARAWLEKAIALSKPPQPGRASRE